MLRCSRLPRLGSTVRQARQPSPTTPEPTEEQGRKTMSSEIDHVPAAFAEISEHARRLHDSSVIVDAACPGEYWAKNFPKWLEGGTSCCVFTIAATDSCRDTMANIAKFYKFYNLSRQYDGPLVLATTTDDIRRAKADGKLAVVLQFQGTHPIEYDPSLVELYWR